MLTARVPCKLGVGMCKTCNPQLFLFPFIGMGHVDVSKWEYGSCHKKWKTLSLLGNHFYKEVPLGIYTGGCPEDAGQASPKRKRASDSRNASRASSRHQ